MGHRTAGRARRLLLATIVSGALLAQNAWAAQGDISTVAGGDVGDGGPATNATLRTPYGVAVDTSGNLFIADANNNRIRKVNASGTITTVAGDGAQGFSGDGGPATNARLYFPSGVAVDTSGNLFIADTSNHRVRKVNASGTITTVAGNGTSGFSGDGGPATNARLYFPSGVAVDTSGNLFIADANNYRIRKVNASGTITTVAGNGTSGDSGDGGPATNASLTGPLGVAVDTAGNLFIADVDWGNHRVRKVNASGTITRVAGAGGNCVGCGDGGPATSGNLQYPNGVAVDTSGNLFIADTGNNRVRRVDASGTITTVAGNGAEGFSGDGGPATSASLKYPYGVAVDTSGTLFIADIGNNRIRKVAAD